MLRLINERGLSIAIDRTLIQINRIVHTCIQQYIDSYSGPSCVYVFRCISTNSVKMNREKYHFPNYGNLTSSDPGRWCVLQDCYPETLVINPTEVTWMPPHICPFQCMEHDYFHTWPAKESRQVSVSMIPLSVDILSSLPICCVLSHRDVRVFDVAIIWFMVFKSWYFMDIIFHRMQVLKRWI